MKRKLQRIIISAAVLLISAPAFAGVRVAAAYPYIKSITEKIGGPGVSVISLASGETDPHYVVPRPSLAAVIRSADLLIINGGGLEEGWLPPVLRESRNSRVQTGTAGYLDLSLSVKLIDIPASVSRSHGDVHPEGNPHFILDPHNVPPVARAICGSLSSVDPANKNLYQRNLDLFLREWDIRLKKWDVRLGSMKGKKVVQYHRLYNYLFKRYGIIIAAEIEPLPGIPPTASHIGRVINICGNGGADFIITDVYHSPKPAKYISEKSGVKLIVLPHDAGAVKGTDDIFKLYDEISRRLADD